MSKARHLLDVNVLLALLDESHVHNLLVSAWFATRGLDWGVCAFTETGFLRVMTNTKLSHAWPVETAKAALTDLEQRAGYRYWPITASWTTLIAPFRERIFGHQQITDALLLGLAVQEGGVLVTMDKAIQHMAGPRLSHHVLVLS